MNLESKLAAQVWIVDGGPPEVRADQLAAEEPLEIRLLARGAPRALLVPAPGAARELRQTVAVTMRTPGQDFELAAGFLYGEGVVRSAADIADISYCTDPGVEEDRRHNIVNVELSKERLPDLKALERHFYTTSACGVCGKASLEALRLQADPISSRGPEVEPAVLFGLPGKLRAHQGVFAATGGLHAAGLFDDRGELLALREDVGRHNALDKLVGWALREGRLPLDRHIVMVSGRTSFELLQKCLMARAPILCAVSAPSTLAVALAKEFGITLVGFLRGERFNVYAGIERIRVSEPVRS
jgi:FdhD protein